MSHLLNREQKYMFNKYPTEKVMLFFAAKEFSDQLNWKTE